MRKTLIATSALAFAGAMAAGPASAADMLSLGVGGYMESWVGFTNRSDDAAATKDVDGGFDVQQDAEIHFSGSLESDMGLKFSVHVELEAANEKASDGASEDDNTEIDESFVRMSGEFGTLEIGQRDPIHARTHYAAGFGAGVGLNAGDTQNWVPGQYLETAGWTVAGDMRNIIYITPRINGVQIGLSYGPDATNENSAGGAPTDNDQAVVAAGINFNHTVGDMSVKVSLGHMNRSRDDSFAYDMDNDASNNDTDGNTSYMMKGNDDRTFTNAGISVGMAGFTFAASYAARDDGAYTAQCVNGTGASAVTTACGEMNDDGNFAGVDANDSGGIDGTEGITSVRAVEDPKAKSETYAVGITYSDGPMTVSVDYINFDRDDGAERTAAGISAGYRLAPGVDWKTSLFSVEDDTKMTEGTAFVTGLDIHF